MSHRSTPLGVVVGLGIFLLVYVGVIAWVFRGRRR